MLSITGVTWGVTLPVLRVEAQGLQKNATQRLPGQETFTEHMSTPPQGRWKDENKQRESLGVRELKENLKRNQINFRAGECVRKTEMKSSEDSGWGGGTQFPSSH